MKYSIAILLPTRGRTDALSRSVMSLINRALDVEKLQLMLGFDDDDTIGIEHFQNELEPWLIEKKVKLDYIVKGYADTSLIELLKHIESDTPVNTKNIAGTYIIEDKFFPDTFNFQANGMRVTKSMLAKWIGDAVPSILGFLPSSALLSSI